jgi:hypothetical protein
MTSSEHVPSDPFDACAHRRVLIDDERTWATDGECCLVARTQYGGLKLLRELVGVQINGLYLDFELGRNADGSLGTTLPIADRLCELAAEGAPALITTIFVHSANESAARSLIRLLQRAGYSVQRLDPAGVFA